MKKIKMTILAVLMVISISGFSQSKEVRNNISIGGGSGGYNGDLGTTWLEMEEEWYGFIGLYQSRYLNASFDLNTSITFGDYGHCRIDGENKYRDDGIEVLNMLGRLTSFVVAVKYKFANGYICKENAKLAPDIYLVA